MTPLTEYAQRGCSHSQKCLCSWRMSSEQTTNLCTEPMCPRWPCVRERNLGRTMEKKRQMAMRN